MVLPFSKYHLCGFLLMLSIEHKGEKIGPTILCQQVRIADKSEAKNIPDRGGVDLTN